MASQSSHLFEAGVLPHNDLVEGVTVSGDDLVGVLAEHQVANL